jgi:glycosyltransferase involved in cell wall biosynthesis
VYTIGISHKTRYWQHYAFTNPPAGYRYARGLDVPWHMLGVKNQFLAHTKYFLPLKRVDLYHTYNGIVANRQPWVVEVESYMPRYRPMPETHILSRWGLRQLAGRNCKAIIYTSQHTLAMNHEKLTAAGVAEARTHVIYRAVRSHEPLPKGGPFTILFVGNGFFRKGGLELLKAFAGITRKDIRLVVISSLEVDWKVMPTPQEIDQAKRTMQADDRILWLPGAPHDTVVRYMREAHVFVNTTYADTFNNAIQEAMACGLPVLVSNVSAIPEMVEHGANGWMVEMEGRTSDDLAEEVRGRLLEIMDDTHLQARMAARSRAIVQERFTLEARNSRLQAIYKAALA